MKKCGLFEGDIVNSLFRRGFIITALMIAFSTACAGPSSKSAGKEASIAQSVFGTLPNGEQVTQYVLQNANGMEVAIITYGGIITSMKVPDKKGNFADVVLGYKTLEGYIKDGYYLGALIGRYGNRIGKARFSIDDKTYVLDTNDGENHVHGGYQGFNKKNWYATAFKTDGDVGVKMQLLSEDGDQKYPGNLTVQVVYTLKSNNELDITFEAVTDKPTVVNLTQHSYFNLAASGDILDHKLMIPASNITPVDAGLIPSGELMPVADTPFDFRTLTTIGARIDNDDQQLKFGLGYDHNFVLDKSSPKAFELAAKLVDPKSGRVLELYSQEPAVQFYSGNFLDGTKTGKTGKLKLRSALCLEPQHSPDSPNLKGFPSTVLRPGEVYSTKMSYRFTTM